MRSMNSTSAVKRAVRLDLARWRWLVLGQEITVCMVVNIQQGVNHTASIKVLVLLHTIWPCSCINKNINLYFLNENQSQFLSQTCRTLEAFAVLSDTKKAGLEDECILQKELQYIQSGWTLWMKIYMHYRRVSGNAVPSLSGIISKNTCVGEQSMSPYTSAKKTNTLKARFMMSCLFICKMLGSIVFFASFPLQILNRTFNELS